MEPTGLEPASPRCQGGGALPIELRPRVFGGGRGCNPGRFPTRLSDAGYRSLLSLDGLHVVSQRTANLGRDRAVVGLSSPRQRRGDPRRNADRDRHALSAPIWHRLTPFESICPARGPGFVDYWARSPGERCRVTREARTASSTVVVRMIAWRASGAPARDLTCNGPITRGRLGPLGYEPPISEVPPMSRTPQTPLTTGLPSFANPS